ncbi:Charged multivesicular body protein 6 [Frankliniella fusca]|uniref:Charged multivesicular body protein 6 n=1 Tax=Frankliniella fusca TaxID=407009 RepID=A0AAE1HND1_9NEOP|nr:Charged multivesicular body protein 6 [Frankliniella fusca]
MGALFGKQKPKSRVTDHDRAVLQLKQQRDKLKLYQKRIQGTLDKDTELARKLLRDGKKDRARLILRKKKYQEQLLITTDNQLETLEKLTQDLEFASIEAQVINGLKVGNEALKKANAIFSIDEIERIMDETREGVEKQQEIDEMLSGVLSDQDEEDVLSELDEIIKEQKKETEPSPVVLDEEMDELPDEKMDDLPDVPDEEPQDSSAAKKAKIKQPKEKIAVAAS